MLGEAAGSREIRLETTAWNELDFRIPDSAGRQPTRTPVIRDAPNQFTSTLPLAAIHARLAGAGHDVTRSDDAGRYLCNQLFYVGRHHLEIHTTPCPAGFIHLPLAQDYSTARAVNALAQVIQVLKGDLVPREPQPPAISARTRSG
jgi:pyroglutamyl-peptidase